MKKLILLLILNICVPVTAQRDFSMVEITSEKLSENIYMVSYSLAEEINMKPETLFAIAEDHSSEMGEASEFDAINIRILTNKYGEFCKALVEKPEDRLSYWLLREGN